MPPGRFNGFVQDAILGSGGRAQRVVPSARKLVQPSCGRGIGASAIENLCERYGSALALIINRLALIVAVRASGFVYRHQAGLIIVL